MKRTSPVQKQGKKERLLESQMKPSRYSTRKGKVFSKNQEFKSAEMAVRGFVREFKSKLLEGQRFSLNEAEYKKVADAFTKLWSEKESSECDFITDSYFSKWWNGAQYPGPEWRENIDKLFPGLSAKWFDRSNFQHRMQLHLASIDLFHLARNCNCKVKKDSEADLEAYCESCLYQVLSEAEMILSTIHTDWRPELTGSNTGDVSISGPKKRAVAADIQNDRMKIDFDLSLEESSLIGLNFPSEIMSSYHAGNPYSIVQFLFLLIGLNIKTQCKYRNDLILDFMTALNCSTLLILVKHKSIFTNSPDYIENNIQKIVMSVSEFFYETPFTVIEQFNEFEDLCEEKRIYPREDCSITYPFTFFHEEFDGQRYLDEELSSLFLEILMFHTPLWSEEAFMEDFKNRYVTHEYKETEADDFISGTRLKLFKPFEAAKECYFEQFHHTGYSREELSKELNEMFVNPMGSKVRWKDKSNKKSAYI